MGLDALIGGLLTEMGDVGTGNYDFLAALTNVVYTMPQRAYMMFPTSAVIGALIGLGQVAASSELTVLRALGLSRRRISLSVILALAVLTALMVVNGETVGPWAQRRADTLKAAAKSKDVIRRSIPGCGRARATCSSTRRPAANAARAAGNGWN